MGTYAYNKPRAILCGLKIFILEVEYALDDGLCLKCNAFNVCMLVGLANTKVLEVAT